MAERVIQQVSSWEGWPPDVVGRLREWNRLFLLSFARTGDFRCVVCIREIAGHPSGNARIRPTRKAKAVECCEECLVRIAREHETPPDLHPHRVAVLQERRRYERLRLYTDKLERHHAKLHSQIARDQLYIAELQARVTPEALDAARAAMRELPR